MKTAVRYRVGLLILLLLLAGVMALIVGKLFPPKPKETPDPHAGQVYIYDGFDWVWMTPLEGIPAATLTREDFSEINGHLTYMGSKYTTIRGWTCPSTSMRWIGTRSPPPAWILR